MIPITMRPPRRLRQPQRPKRGLQGRNLSTKREDSLRSGLFKKKVTKRKVSKPLKSRIEAVLTRFKKTMVSSNRAFIRDLATVINQQRLPRNLAFRKMVLALPTLEDKLNRIKGYYNPDYPEKWIKNGDLDGVSGWPPADAERNKKLLSVLTARVNEYMQQGPDNDRNKTLHLPEEYVALLDHCDAVQDPDLRSIGVGGLHGSWCVWPYGEKADCLVPLNASAEGTIALCAQYSEPPSAWEFKTAFMIDRTPLMYCVYGYTRYRKDYIHPPNSPFPKRKVTKKDYDWKWRIFYEGSGQKENSKVFDSLPQYLNWLGGWYGREVNGDLSIAAAQADKPDFMLGDVSGDTESCCSGDTVLVDDDGSDTEPFTDDEGDNGDEDEGLGQDGK